LLTAAVAGCGERAPVAGVAAVGRGTVTEVVEAPATVTPRATVTLAAPADGTVATLAVRDGQQVRAGTVLVRVDSPSAQRRLREVRQADARAAAAVGTTVGATVPTRAPAGVDAVQVRADAEARRAFGGARAAALLISEESVRAQALAAVATAESQYAAARAAAQEVLRRVNAGLAGLSAAITALSEAQRIQTRAAVAVAEQAVGALDVRAPISGVVSLGGPAGAPRPDLSAASGSLSPDLQQALAAAGGGQPSSDVVAAGVPVRAGQPVVTLTDVSALTLAAEVDETDVLLVRAGVPAAIELDAVPDATYRGRVTSVDLTPTQTARGGVTYRVRLTLDGGTRPDGRAAPLPRPGMNAVARLRVREARDALSVPASAVLREGGRDVVWVAQDGRARRRDVVLGAQGEDRVQVVGGLRDGEQVVVRGADRLRDGQQLRR
ncbi:MAG TPA: efflux RND transporter periplasmic adaptor subunit, partial [Mycobacteriales bacterium]|nr:efflux RND transporter periplasmic adaptor subunit [Mycobacteriales bacterium]